MGSDRWLLLMPDLPNRPESLEAAVVRRLRSAGSVAVRPGVYALPASDTAQEDFQWVRREILAAGGRAMLVETDAIDGVDPGELEALFRNARAGDYAPLLEDARAMLEALPTEPTEATRASVAVDLARLRRQHAEVAALDFFGAPGRDEVLAVLQEVARRLDAGSPSGPAPDLRGRIWVTRRGIAIDRMASAWLVLRFVDPNARFKWVAPRGYVPDADEVRFDMFEAEYTHEGSECTFEVLRRRLGLQADPGLTALAEMVHDLDLKDGRYGRPETAGLAALLAGVMARYPDDDARLTEAARVLDDLYAGLTATG